MKSAGPAFKFDFNQIKKDVLSETQETRGSAMQALLFQSRKDPSIHPHAIEIFRRAISTAPDAWTAISAGRGIELIAGPDEGRQVWLALLHHRDPLMVGRVALSINHDSYVPVLLEILQQRPENALKGNVMRALGRLKDTSNFPVIVPFLDVPELRLDAIQTLQDLGDIRAIPLLEPIVADNTDAWRQDERGAMLTVGDIANDAIKLLRAPHLNINPELNKSYWDLPRSKIPPSAPKQPAAVRQPNAPSSLPAYIPLIAAVLEIPWIGAVIIGQLFLTGEFKPTPVQTRILAAVGMTPAVVGLFTGITLIVTRRPRRLIDRIFLGIGFSVCGLIIIWLGQDLVR